MHRAIGERGAVILAHLFCTRCTMRDAQYRAARAHRQAEELLLRFKP
jgi:hypothetical protein